MILKAVFIFISFAMTFSHIQGQTALPVGEIVDSRDGQTYQTVTVNNTIWLSENMKYKTPNSITVDNNEYGNSYFYPHDEADDVCPNEFRIPTENEFKAYFETLLELKNIPKNSVEYFTAKKKNNAGWGMSNRMEELQLFEEPNPLNLKESGIFQGNKFSQDGALSFWSRKAETSDTKYHFHIESDYFFNHTHKHNIITSKKKQRRFVIRCVKTVVSN